MGPLHTDLAGTSGIRNILYQAPAWAGVLHFLEQYQKCGLQRKDPRTSSHSPLPSTTSISTFESIGHSTPGCLVPVNEVVEAPLALTAARLALQAVSETLVVWGKAIGCKLGAQFCLGWLSGPVCAA